MSSCGEILRLKFSCEVKETPPNRISDFFFFFAQLCFKISVSNDDQSAVFLTKECMFCPVLEKSVILEQQVHTSCFDNLPYPSAFHLHIVGLVF